MTEFTFLGELSLSAHKNTRFTQKSQLQEKYQCIAKFGVHVIGVQNLT